MPFLRDEGPPVSKDTIQRARESLPLEYGFQIVNETGREVLLVRVPKAKPDYLHDLGDVAFYVTLDTIRSCKDVLLIGHEKTARLEPQLLRDNIRAQDREDVALVTDLRRRLSRDFGQQMLQSPSNFVHQAFAVRIPAQSISEFSAEHVTTIRAMIERQRARFEACQYAYVVADRDHERLGRRVLLELLGQPAQTAETPAAIEPIAAPTAIPASAATTPSHAFSFPITPGTGMTQPMAANAATAGPVALPSIFSATQNVVTPQALPANAAPAPTNVPIAQAEEPLDLPSLTDPDPTPAPVTAPAPTPAPATNLVDDHEEYAIISKPKPAPAPVATAPVAPKPASANVAVHDEYEIVTKPKPAAAPAAEAIMPSHPDVERKVARATDEFEVYTSKPKVREHEPPAITPPGQGGFQAALNAATSTGGHVPMKTKQYEIMGGRPAPQVEASSPVARMLSRPHDDPRVQPAVMAQAPAAPPPSPDNGVPVIAQVAPARSEAVLAQKFKDAGYEIVEGLRAQGTQFAFAAHKPNGRRVLLKRSPDFSGEEAANLSGLVTALGADICLVVAERIAPGTRLATWGTRIEVYTPAEAGVLTF